MDDKHGFVDGFVDKIAGGFHVVNRQITQITQAGIPCAETIEREPASELFDGLEGSQQSRPILDELEGHDSQNDLLRPHGNLFQLGDHALRDGAWEHVHENVVVAAERARGEQSATEALPVELS